MKNAAKWIAGGALAAALVAGGAGVAVGVTGSDDGDGDVPLTGADLDRATEAALEKVGSGAVVDSEVGDDGAAYSVEVRKEDGSVVDVNLDEAFAVIGVEADDDDGEPDGPGDD